MTPFGCREIQVDDEPPTDQQKLDELNTKVNFFNWSSVINSLIS